MDIGQTLDGRYLLRERIGVGATSTVFRAEDVELGRAVAVKVFGPESVVSDSARRRREARILAGLRHPAIVALFDARLGGDPPYLVLEHVAGTTLAGTIARGPLSREETRRIGASAAEGLAAAHAEGIVHRDVKPANLVVVDDDPHAAARLLDFGIAHSEDVSHSTRPGSVLGSALYLSPEQARGHELTPASDVYSLGLVLIECLTGRPAFPGAGLEAVAARLTTPPALDDPALAADAPLLARMTSLEPADRPDAAEVARALADPAPTLVLPPAGGEVPAPARTADLPPTEVHPALHEENGPGSAHGPSARRRRRTAALAGAGAALVVAAAGALLLGLLGPGPGGTPGTDAVPAKILLPDDDDAEPAVDAPGPGDDHPGNGNGNQGDGNPGNGNRGNGNGPPDD